MKLLGLNIIPNREYKSIVEQSQLAALRNNAITAVNLIQQQYTDWKTIDALTKYSTNTDVYSVIKKIENKTTDIESYVYYQTDENKKLKKIHDKNVWNIKKLIDARILQKKSLEDAPDDDDLAKLLANPNPNLSEKEFEQFLIIYLCSSGEFFVWKNKVPSENGGNNAGKPMELWQLNPNLVTVNVSKEFPQTVTQYQLDLGGSKISFEPDEIIHVKFPNPQNPFRGLSPLKVGSNSIQIDENAESRIYTQLKNGTLPGVIYDKAIPYEKQAQETLDKKRKALYDFQSNPNNTNTPYFTAGELGFIPTGLKLTDLDISELYDIIFGKICNLFGLSARLFNRKGESTQQNQDVDTKNAYLDCYLPIKNTIINAYNSQLAPDFPDNKTKKRFISIDTSSITVLQSDIEKQASAMWSGPGGFTLNEMRAIFNYDDSGEDGTDKILLKSGYDFVENLILPPIDPANISENISTRL